VKANFTPAPWSVELDLSNDGDIDVQAADFLAVASIDVRGTPGETGSVPREVALANANLIAAAPGLYEALSELVMMNERWNADVREIIGRPPSWTDQYLTTARLALKKARGEH
jgi:hypothetical protein